jgi:hypothetical protein
MSDIQLISDQEVVAEGRVNPLQDDASTGLKVTASLRDQQLEKLASKLDEKNMGNRIVDTWYRANADRTLWLERQARFLEEVDEFIEPIYDSALEWSSVLHLPTILTACKAYHARMYAALMSVDPPFTMRARQAANADRAMLNEELMRYTLNDWCNEYEGVGDPVDRWLWDWVTKGCGILKARWHKKFTRYMDVDIDRIEDVDMETDPQTGQKVPITRMREIEKEVTRTEEVFNGPMLERVPIEDFIIVGGEGDPQKADYVMEQYWLTSSDLYSMADQKKFREDVVEDVIKAGKSYPMGHDQTSDIKQRQIESSGMASINKEHALDRYRIIEAYLKIDVDGSGIASDIIVWVHYETKKILRATYLRRVMPTGQIPFFKTDFHIRQGVEYGVGLIELLYSLGKEVDAIHNIKVDVGILSSMPFGFYRPTASALKEERMPLEPGTLIPVDNPQTDVYFPNLGMRTSFGFQEEQALQVQIDRLSSMSDLNYGILAGQGAARTATGARAVLGESSNNLNIYIQRMNRSWKRALKYIFSMLQYRLPPGFQFRLQGDDGENYWKEIKSREEIMGMYDFELEANSVNSNKQVQSEQANMLVQITGNPLDLQLGIVTPLERYEALSYQMKVAGIKDVSKFLRKPDQQAHKFTPLEIADRTLAGMDVKLDPTQDFQGFIAVVQEILDDDSMNGQFDHFHINALVAKAKEAQALQSAMKQAQAQAAAAQQQQMNTMASMTPSNMQPVNVYQQPGQGEGG